MKGDRGVGGWGAGRGGGEKIFADFGACCRDKR